MTHRFFACLAIASLTFLAPRPAAAADIASVFATVDTVEIHPSHHLTVAGILVGQTTTTTLTLPFYDADLAERCGRLALLAMSKPGKYRFVMTQYNGSYVNRCSLRLQMP